jgi:hypothetical protein
MVLDIVTQLKSMASISCWVVANAQNTVSSLRGKHTPKNTVMGRQMVLDRVTQLKSIDTMLCRVVENAQNTMSSLRGKQTPKTYNDVGVGASQNGDGFFVT